MESEDNMYSRRKIKKSQAVNNKIKALTVVTSPETLFVHLNLDLHVSFYYLSILYFQRRRNNCTESDEGERK